MLIVYAISAAEYILPFSCILRFLTEMNRENMHFPTACPQGVPETSHRPPRGSAIERFPCVSREL